MDSNNNNQEQYKPSNPILVFFRLTKKILIYTLLLVLAGISILFFKNTWLAYILMGLAVLYYIYNRKKFLKDYERVKIGKLPLLYFYSHDLSLKDNIVAFLLIVGAIIFLLFTAKPILEFFGR